MPIVEAPAGVVRVEQIMGMPIVVDVRDISEPAALDPLFDWFQEVDTRFSTYNSESEISRLNRGELTPIETHPDVREVLARCDEIRVETHGYFDARAHAAGDIDPSGLVKGWAVDRAAELADELGWRTWAISAGGDMRLRAARPDPSWRVGIQDPTNRNHIVAVVEADDLAIATSGTYARGEHIFDPHSRRPPTGLSSVTITGSDLATADAYATAAFAMGTDGPAWTARLQGYDALTLLDDGRSLRTPGFGRAH
jgi:thiamine biosynthesis lipoprotein